MGTLDSFFPEGLEPLLSSLAVRLVSDGAEREVGLLAVAQPSLVLLRTDPTEGELYALCLMIPSRLFAQLGQGQAPLEERLLKEVRGLLPRPIRNKVVQVSLASLLNAERDWRQRAQRWSRGGRVDKSRESGDKQKEPKGKRERPTPALTVEIGRTEAERAPSRSRVAPPARPKAEPIPAKIRYKETRMRGDR